MYRIKIEIERETGMRDGVLTWYGSILEWTSEAIDGVEDACEIFAGIVRHSMQDIEGYGDGDGEPRQPEDHEQ